MFAEKLPARNVAYFIRGISFCNIPLSMISEHVKWYGSYAIGLKRSKLREKGTSPVFYVHSDTKQMPAGKGSKDLLRKNPFLCYLKQHFGYQYNRTEKKYRSKRFYDEKEWRLFAGDPIIENYSSLEDLENIRVNFDAIVPAEPELKITSDMIEYIILEKPNDLKEFDDFLKNNVNDRDNYLTKILFYTQIRKDF